MNTAE